MADYIEREAAIAVADYAADEHPYSKEAAKPETWDKYNQGWNDACDYIKGKMEIAPAADVAPVVHGQWNYCTEAWALKECYMCTACGYPRYERYAFADFKYCPHCGAKMRNDEEEAKE